MSKQFGELNAKKNMAAFAGDPDVHFLRGLEVMENDQWRGSDIFQRRTFSPAASYNASTPEEALAVSLNVKGRVDVDYMATILGMPRNEVVQALVSSGQIFLNPETRAFERRAQYLSGAVKSKMEAAKSAAEVTPSYRANLQALEQVQPARIGAGDIYLSMGSSWIPQDVMNQGLAEILSGHNRYDREIWQDGKPRELVAYSAETGTWGPSSGMFGRRSNQNAAWGTDDVPAAKIIEHAVSNRPLRVNTKDDEGKSHFDEVATRAAKQKIDELRERFTKWAWEDPERASHLEDVYNESQNVSVPRQYDASHLTFPGMTAEWQKKMLPHQREAVDRVVQDGNVMLAHEVGFGKTASMVASAMERKRLGLSQKPMFVLPNATAAQFAADFREMYPTSRILFEENIGGDNRKAFLDRVRNNDWDAVLLTYSQFERVPVTVGTLDKYQALQMEQLDAGLEQAKTEGNEYREKQIQLLKKKADTAFKKKREKLESLFDQGAVPFEHLGVDQLFVDEADNFKNLAFFTGLDNIKGLNPNTSSMRGWDMYMKTQLIQGRAGQIRNAKGEALRGGVVFATGSSISNSLAEMWTMMRYLHLDELEKRGLDTFDAWAGNYGRMEEAIEVRASGEYKPTTRFSKFANLPELSALWQGVADIRVQSELPVMLERQPRLVDEDGSPKRVNVQAPSTPAVAAYMKHIATRAKELDSDTVRDNMLKLSGDARKASLDVRFAPPFAQSAYPWPPPAEAGVVVEANPQGKIPLLVDRVSRIYQDESEQKGTQLVFLDMGTPSAKEKDGEATSKDSDEQDELDMNLDEKANLKETYDMIRRSLEAKGIPSNEIAFIHDYKKNEQKQRLYRQVRDGQIRVVLGSTNKLGVGVNVQDRLAAIHHMDVPWRPRDVEQREGRIIRAGNEVYGPKFDPDDPKIMIDKGLGVKVYKYIQQGSFDEFMWQAVEKKAAGIKAITKRNVATRESDDLDEFVLSASEARALASGDPRAVELVTLETKLAGMKLDRAAYESQRSNAQSQIGTLTNRVDVLSGQIPNYARDAAFAEQMLEKDEFAASDREGKSIAKRPDAEKEMKAILSSTPFGQEVPLGTYKGFKLFGANRDTGYQIILESTATGQKYTSKSFDNPDSANVLGRADNVIKAVVSAHAEKVDQLAGAQGGLRSYRTQLDKPYDQMGELTQMERRVKELRTNVQGVEDVKTGTEGKSVEFSREKLVEEDIQKATDEDMIDAEQKVLAQIMERRRKDRAYQTPTGDAFDGLVSEALQDILDDRRQEETGIDPQVDPDLMDDVPAAVPADLRDDAATAIEEPFDIDPGDASDIGETARKDDLTPGEVGDVVERVAERVQLEAEDDESEEGPKATVISLAEVDSMLQEEMKDEGIEEGIIPQAADTDYDDSDDEDSYVDVDGTLIPEAQQQPAEAEAPGEFEEVVAMADETQPVTMDSAGPSAEAAMGDTAAQEPRISTLGKGRRKEWLVEYALPNGRPYSNTWGTEDQAIAFVAYLKAQEEQKGSEDTPPEDDAAHETDVSARPAPEETPQPEINAKGNLTDLQHALRRRPTPPDPAPVEADAPSPSAEPGMDMPAAAEMDAEIDEGDQLDPESPGKEWEPADAEERRLATQDTLEAMPDATRDYHDDVLYPRVSDVADEYDTALLAMRLGADPDPVDLDREEGALRRKAALASGQSDMFGATSSLPATMVLPPDTGSAQAIVEERDPQREVSPGRTPLVPDSQAVVDAAMDEGKATPGDVAEDALADLEGRPDLDPEEVEDALGDLDGRAAPDAQEADDDAQEADDDAQEADDDAQEADDDAQEANDDAQEANDDAQEADDDAQEAEADAQEADDDAQEANDDAQEAEADAQEADDDAQEAEADAQEADDDAQEAEADAQEADDDAQEAEADAQEANDDAQEADDDAQEAEADAQEANDDAQEAEADAQEADDDAQEADDDAQEADTGPIEPDQAAEPTAQRQRLRKRLETLQREYLAAQRDGDKKKAASVNAKAEEIEMDLKFLGSRFQRKDVKDGAVPRRATAKPTRAMIPDDAEAPVKELVGATASGGGKAPRGRTPGHLKDKSGHSVRGGGRAGAASRVPGEIRVFARQVKRR